MPRTLIQIAKDAKSDASSRAKREEDPSLEIDEVSCFFDVDEHPDIPAALAMARDAGIRVAVSSPCFELWLILHFRDGPGGMHRHKLQKLMRKHIPDYDKRVDYADYDAGYHDAVFRAQKLSEQSERVGDSIYNPSTGVHRLTELVRGREEALPRRRKPK